MWYIFGVLCNKEYQVHVIITTQYSSSRLQKCYCYGNTKVLCNGHRKLCHNTEPSFKTLHFVLISYLTVSYTHLDVYKRQHIDRQTHRHTHRHFSKNDFFHVLSVVESESAIISNTIFFCHHHTCLLYTSRCV